MISGTIFLHKSLPQGERVYTLTIAATDGGSLSALQRAEVQISVTGPDYSPPEFERSMYRFQVKEDVQPDKSVGRVRATYPGSTTGKQRHKRLDWFNKLLWLISCLI